MNEEREAIGIMLRALEQIRDWQNLPTDAGANGEREGARSVAKIAMDEAASVLLGVNFGDFKR